jgi:hypothetical protein
MGSVELLEGSVELLEGSVDNGADRRLDVARVERLARAEQFGLDVARVEGVAFGEPLGR